ncbi:MAG: hypothetical protein ACUVQY_10675, partial [Thermoproteota archaeon]
DFETLDVGEMWLERLPYHMVYTAERVAYRNLVNGLKPPETALNLNPYREWIGARIRADIWGYVTPEISNWLPNWPIRTQLYPTLRMACMLKC